MPKHYVPPRLIPEGHPLDLLGRIKDLPLKPLTVLNLGAGICGSPISEQLHYLPCNRLIHVEKFKPYMEQLKQMPFAAAHVEFLEMDVRDYVNTPCRPTADLTLIIDVLEHLPREDAETLLQNVIQTTKRRVLIWLPLGECPVEPFHDNPYQAHLSTWYADDDIFKGFKVEHFPAYHQHLDPPADAGWVTINTDNPSAVERLRRKLRGY